MRKIIVSGLFLLMLLITTGGALNAQLNQQAKQKISNLEEQINKAIQSGNESQAASYYNQAANIYWNASMFDKAVKSYENALAITERMGNANGTMIIHNSLGMIYIDMEVYNKAITHLEEGLKLSRQLKARETTASTLTNLATAYQQNKKYSRAIELLNEAVALSNELNDMVLLRRCYGLLYEVHDQAGNSEKAYEYFNIYSSFDKEIKKVEMEEVKTQAKTEVNKAVAEKQEKEKELDQTTDMLRQTEDSLARAEKLTREQRLEIQLKESQLSEEQAKTRARNQLILLIGFALLITLLFLFIVFKQKRAIEGQKIQIERQNKNIKASIRYAQTIQNAILPALSIKNNEFEAFTVYRPKDIVSGDFYWYTQIHNNDNSAPKHLIAVVDCTGHGVPGAFMSMIGSRLLNELVNERKIYEPEKILTELNKEVRIALRQHETDNNDGMDVSLCVLDKQQDNEILLTYSGAKRPLYYILNESDQINRLKGARKSIGGLQRNEGKVKFFQTRLTLHSGDVLYQFSDGIVDQNDQTRRRFGSQRLEKLLLGIHKKSVNEQQEEINSTLNNFVGSEEQRDDITLMGIQII
ncbi:MAG: tetratricopeptide repeat protein [Bacteroidetes bacterium]|jgi:serine phosphatase RsbU (regulator of sigma subunit)|nr:tetratricopeptide repeat protein [Bacteroidota bacterium]